MSEIIRRQTIVINSGNRTSGTIQNSTYEFPASVVALDNRIEMIMLIPTQFVTR